MADCTISICKQEKISEYKGYGVFDEDSTVERTKDFQTEYTRTDTFIEKACEYLEPILTEYAGFYVGGGILQHFKKYMKGE